VKRRVVWSTTSCLVDDEEDGVGDAGGGHLAPDRAGRGFEDVISCELRVFWGAAPEGVSSWDVDEESVTGTAENELLGGRIEAVVEELFDCGCRAGSLSELVGHDCTAGVFGCDDIVGAGCEHTDKDILLVTIKDSL
jgi:hypothetical protein